MPREPICKKCGKTFSTMSSMQRHMNKKNSCTKVHRCKVCNETFKFATLLKKHQQRITPCVLIHGDVNKEVPSNACRFCLKLLSTPYSLNRHYKHCKIKNGNMDVLFKTIDNMNKKLKLIKNKSKPPAKITVNNHFNTQILIQFANYGDMSTRHRMVYAARDYVQAVIKNGIQCTEDNVCKQIEGLVMAVHRNQENRDLQNVYVQDPNDMESKDNAFMYKKNKWESGDWRTVSRLIFSEMYNCIMNSPLGQKNKLFNKVATVLGKYGHGYNSDTAHPKDLITTIGKKLTFDSIK